MPTRRSHRSKNRRRSSGSKSRHRLRRSRRSTNHHLSRSRRRSLYGSSVSERFADKSLSVLEGFSANSQSIIELKGTIVSIIESVIRKFESARHNNSQVSQLIQALEKQKNEIEASDGGKILSSGDRGARSPGPLQPTPTLRRVRSMARSPKVAPSEETP